MNSYSVQHLLFDCNCKTNTMLTFPLSIVIPLLQYMLAETEDKPSYFVYGGFTGITAAAVLT